MLSIRRLIGLTSVLFVLSACGGGGSSGDSGGQTPPPTTPTYSVATSVTGSGSGSISPTSRTVSQGSTTSFTVSAASGSTIAGVSGCGGSLSGTTYTTGAISSGCTVTATFDLNMYTVTTVPGPGGTISPGSASVTHGRTYSFGVLPNSGYQIDSVSGCNGSLSGNTYTTAPATANCTVTASFNATVTPPPTTYTVTTTTSGEGSGSITPSSATVNSGQAATFQVVAAEGSAISSVTGCDGSLSGNTYTTASIIADCLVTVAFSPDGLAFVSGIANGLSDTTITGLWLRINGDESIWVDSNAEFTFPTRLPVGTSYSVAIASFFPHEDGQPRCMLLNAEGVVGQEGSSEINLRCVEPIALSGVFQETGLTLVWQDINANRYNVFAMPQGITDIQNYSAYPGAELVTDTVSPSLAKEMFSLGTFTFVVEAVFDDGHVFQSVGHDDINATPLGGILPGSIYLTKEESPYRNYSTVQIGTGITMEIGPGAEYVGSLEAEVRDAVAIYEGRVKASGTPEEPVKIQNLKIESIYGIPTTTGEIDLAYAWVKGGAIGANAQRLVIKNSYLEDVSVTFASGSMFEAPTEEGVLIIERNVLNNNYILIRECNGKIRNNVFIKPESTPMVIIRAGNVAGLVFRYNSFLGTADFSDEPYVIILNSLAGDVDARENFWDTTDLTLIPSYIADGSAYVGPGGIVYFEPILLEPHPETPVFP